MSRRGNDTTQAQAPDTSRLGRSDDGVDGGIGSRRRPVR